MTALDAFTRAVSLLTLRLKRAPTAREVADELGVLRWVVGEEDVREMARQTGAELGG